MKSPLLTVLYCNLVSGVNKVLRYLDMKEIHNLNEDLTETLERKIQRVLRKTNYHLQEKEYKKMYPAGSKPRLFFGTAKSKIGEILKEPTVGLIILNIRTATYKTGKYLITSLTLLTKWQYNILSRDDFIQKIKRERRLKGFNKIPLHVKSLFINVPLHQTVKISLSKVYHKIKLKTSIPKNIPTELLDLFAKEVYFIFNDEIYIQKDGVAIGSPLGSLLANLFMMSLEEAVKPKLTTPYLLTRRDTLATHTLMLIPKNSILF